jgi:hypothetical protein
MTDDYRPQMNPGNVAPTGQLPPGRELDALVAEKVFGASVTWRDENRFDGTNVTRVREVYAPYPSNPAAGTKRLPAYSTDIAAAWEVRNAVRNWIFGTDHVFEKRQNFTEILRSLVSARVIGRDGELMSHSEIFLHVEPVDICLAALKAVGA